MTVDPENFPHSPDIAERMAFRLWKKQTGTLEQGAGELRLVIDMQRSLGATGLASSIKLALARDGYITQEIVDGLLETQLEDEIMDEQLRIVD